LSDLDALVDELQQTADRLRAGETDPERAAQLVERCAELAASVASELDREARELEGTESPDDDQRRLL
jgi:hypothetical protein